MNYALLSVLSLILKFSSQFIVLDSNSEKKECIFSAWASEIANSSQLIAGWDSLARHVLQGSFAVGLQGILLYSGGNVGEGERMAGNEGREAPISPSTEIT